MIKNLIVVGLGGSLGSMARYLTTRIIYQQPLGTFTVNIIGCLIIGIVYGLSERFGWLTTEWRLFLTVGLCSGYTTFSTFAYENLKLLQSTHYLNTLLYTTASILLGLTAVSLGIWLIK